MVETNSFQITVEQRKQSQVVKNFDGRNVADNVKYTTETCNKL